MTPEKPNKTAAEALLAFSQVLLDVQYGMKTFGSAWETGFGSTQKSLEHLASQMKTLKKKAMPKKKPKVIKKPKPPDSITYDLLHEVMRVARDNDRLAVEVVPFREADPNTTVCLKLSEEQAASLRLLQGQPFEVTLHLKPTLPSEDLKVAVDSTNIPLRRVIALRMFLDKLIEEQYDTHGPIYPINLEGYLVAWASKKSVAISAHDQDKLKATAQSFEDIGIDIAEVLKWFEKPPA